MARVDLPRSRLRTRRRKRRRVLAAATACACLAALGGVAWLSWAPFVRITAVDIAGVSTVATSAIEESVKKEIAGTYFFIFPRNNIFLYPRESIAQGLLEQYPALRAVDVHAENFHTIAVRVAERQPVAEWCGDTPESCLYLDEQGIAYAPAPQFSGPVYVNFFGLLSSTTPAQYLSVPQFQSLFALAQALDQKVPDDSVVSVSVDTQEDARVSFASGFVLMFSLKDDGGDLFDRFSLALTSAPFTGKQPSDFKYLDLRFGDKLYYKLK